MIRSSGSSPSGSVAILHRLARLEQRQHQLRRALGGPQARLVAVEAEDRRVVHPPEQLQVLLGQRRAERRHRALEPRRHRRDHVEIALDHDHRLAVARRRLRVLAVVERPALLKRAAVSGELRYFAGTSALSARPPKAITRPRKSVIGNITRLRNRS